MTQVTLHQLSQTYPQANLPAVHRLNLTLPTGQITALLGPSGCGKTTVLKMIAGLVEPTEGDIQFSGKSVLNLLAERRGAVMVFQSHLLFPYMSVGENVGFGLKMRGVDAATVRRRVATMLEWVQLGGLENRRPKQLSGGQQQRVALARALIVEPQVLLLDEPLSNLDAHLRGEMRDLILTIQRKLAITTIFVTHDQEEAMLMADQIALMFVGRLQQFAPPRDFYERPVSVGVARFFGGVNFIPATKHGLQLETPLGILHSLPHTLPDGPVMLTIRPENLKIKPHGPTSPAGSNIVLATIQQQLYLGTHVRFTVQANNLILEVVAEPRQVDQFRLGQTVHLEFPALQIWLLPMP